MTNYIKSELYRVSRNLYVYLFIGAVAALMLIGNMVSAMMNKMNPEYRYGTMGFMVGILSSFMGTAMIAAVFLNILIFADELKNRTINNTIAFGMSRTKVMLGKYIVTLIVSAIGLIVVEGVMVFSARLLLGNTGWGTYTDGWEAAKGLLGVDIACIPLFMAAIAIHYALLFWTRNEMPAVAIWLGGVVGVGQIVGLLAMKFPVFAAMEKCLIYRLTSMYVVDEATGNMKPLWEIPGGTIWTVMVGMVTTVIFLALAVTGSRKKSD